MDQSQSSTDRIQNVDVGKLVERKNSWLVYECGQQDGKNIICKVAPEIERNEDHILNTIRKTFVKEASMYTYLGNRIPGVSVTTEIGPGYIKLEDPGTRLSEAIERGLSLDNTLMYMAKLLVTLNMLHQERIAHLSLTPDDIYLDNSNINIGSFDSAIMINKDSYGTFYKARSELINAGKCVFDVGNNRYTLDTISLNDGAMVYEYAAPENFYIEPKTKRKPLSPASDIWGAGAILYEMISKKKFSLDSLSMENGKVEVYSERSWIDRAIGPLDFAGIITEDMKRYGFCIYDKNWEARQQVISIHESNPKCVGLNKISPYNALIERFPEEEDKIKQVWELLVNMLDPNPITRYSAQDCLSSEIFKPYKAEIAEMWRRYTPVTKPKHVEPVDLRRIEYSKYFSDEVLYYTKHPPVNSIYERVFSNYPELSTEVMRLIHKLDPFVGKWFGRIRNGQLRMFVMYFAIFIVANYIVYGHTIDTLILDTEHPPRGVDYIKDVHLIHNKGNYKNSIISKLILPINGVSMVDIQNMIYTSVYFILVNVLEFRFWT